MDSTSTLNPADEPTQTSVPFPDPTTSTTASAPVAAASACSNCGAALAADQRYCLVCGERNGDPRLPVMTGRDALSSPATPAAVTTTATQRGPRGGGSTNTALIAGVGTLLVALGVGVVIGRSSDNNNSTAKTPQVITVGAPAAAAAGGAAVAGATSGTTPGDTSGAAGSTSGASDGKAKDAKSSGGDKSSSKADTSKAPASGKVPAKKGTVVRLGQRGSGKGYKNGKFTGDFFGG